MSKLGENGRGNGCSARWGPGSASNDPLPDSGIIKECPADSA